MQEPGNALFCKVSGIADELCGSTFFRAASRAAVLLAALSNADYSKAQIYSDNLNPEPPGAAAEDVQTELNFLYGKARTGELSYNQLSSNLALNTGIVTLLQDQLRTDLPADYRQHVRWQTDAHVLRALTKIWDEALLEKSAALLTQYIESTEGWQNEKRPIDALDRHLRTLHLLSTVVVYSQHQRCLDRINELEVEALQEGNLLRQEMRRNAQASYGDAQDLKKWWRQGMRSMLDEQPGWNGLRHKFMRCGDRTYYTFRNGCRCERWEVMSLRLHSGDYDGVLFKRLDRFGPSLSLSNAEAYTAMSDGSIRNLLRQATADYQKRRSPERVAKLRSFDLPRDTGFVHIRLFPWAADDVMDQQLVTSIGYVQALKRHYGDSVVCPPIVFSSSPVENLARAIDPYYRQGYRFFSLDLSAHGNHQYGFYFHNMLTAEGLAELTHRFPDAEFCGGSLACYGGGQRDPLLSLPHETKGRISFAFQAPPDLVINTSVVSMASDVSPTLNYTLRGTFHTLQMIDMLYSSDPRTTFGKLLDEVDLRCINNVPQDPETVIRGDFFSSIHPANHREKLLLAS